MKAVDNVKLDTDASSIERIRELLFQLLKTRAHELSDEALKSRQMIKEFFLSDGK